MDADILLKLAGLVVTLCIAIVGYIMGSLKAVNARTEATSKALGDHRVEIAAHYVPRAELASALTNIRAESKADTDRLEKRFDKMESWMGRRFDMIMGRVPVDKD